jgi:2-dehydro-3-deoxygluconokinase
MSATIVTLGELMMRLTPPRKLRLRQTSSLDLCHGGAEANVANALANLGLSSRFVTALPDTELGTQALMTLRANGVDTEFVSRLDGRMGLYFMEEGADARSGCVIYDRADTAFSRLSADDIDWDRVFDGADWFHISGITPAISASTLALTQKSITAAKARGIHVSLDLNYRARLWNYGVDPIDVLPAMVAQVDSLIAGRGDCMPCIGIDGDGENGSDDWASSLSEKLKREFPNLANVAVTIRASSSADQHDWKACLRNDSGIVFSREYALKNIVDRVGTGDAFCAGLIFGLLMEPTAQAAVEFGAAANCLKHSIVGDVAIVTASEVHSVAADGGTGRLRR